MCQLYMQWILKKKYGQLVISVTKLNKFSVKIYQFLCRNLNNFDKNTAFEKVSTQFLWEQFSKLKTFKI